MKTQQLLAAFGLLIVVALPAQAQQLIASGGLKLGLGPDGAVTSLSVGDKPWPLTQGALSGLLLRDAAADGQFVAAGGAVATAEGGLRQAGTNAALKLDFAATYRARPGAVEVQGFVHDLSGQDRAITVRFALPVQAAGGVWWQDLLNQEPIAGGSYANLHHTGVGATGNTSAFPWGAISAAPGELCLGVPMDRFVVHRLAYDGAAQCFTLDFDFGLSPLTKAFPSRADFSLVIYTPDARTVAGARQGFRAATAAYYALFPEAFARRSEKEGLWMPFTDIARVQDPEDFNFAFQEGASNIPWDEAHGIYSFRYISPHWAMLWMPERQEKPTPEFVQQKLAEDLKSDNPATRKAAQIIMNCAGRNAQGGLQYTVGQAHWAPHKTGYLGWYAMCPANADPDLGQLGKGPTTGTETMASVDRDLATYNKPGSFLDGFYFDGVDERPLDNYAAEQFAFASAPLTFSPDTKRPILCGAFSSYKFLQRVADKMHASGRLVMANGIPSQFPFSLQYLDLGGSEQEPSIESPPVRLSYLTYARALMYHKPLVLLYKPRLEERFDRDLTPYLVDYMHACLPYAAEPSLFMIFSNTDPSFYYNFWERPDWYNKYRSLFIAYAPLVKRLALAGWEPVTGAAASDPSIVVERFGKLVPHLVAYNPAREGAPITFDLDVDPPTPPRPAEGGPRLEGMPLRPLTGAVNLVDGTAVPLTRREGGGARVRLTLAPRRAAVLAFASANQQLASFDLGEAARYGAIAQSRLRERLNPTVAINFETDPGDTGTPTGFAPYREGEVVFASDTKTVHSAPRATRVTMAGKARAVQSVNLPVKGGRKVHFSLWGKAELPTPGSLSFYIRWKDAAGKDTPAVNSPSISATGDWQQIELDATAPDNAASVMFALVGTHQGEGTGTLWFDDPSIVTVGDDGKQTTLLPVAPVAPSAADEKLTTALQQRADQLRQLAASAPRTADATLCGQVLNQAGQLDQQVAGVRRDTPDYGGIASALEASAGRLRRAGGILAGWQMTLTGGGQVALGEQAAFQVTVQAGPVALQEVQVSLAAGGLGPGAFSLAPRQTRTLQFVVSPQGGVGSGERVGAIARARVAGGQTLSLERDASYTVVSPCESSLTDEGQDETGRVRRLLLVARNTRRERPLAVRVAVTAPPGFSSSVTTETVEMKAGAELKLPIVLTAGADLQTGWRETTVKVSWEGGEQDHQYAQLYMPAAANLLKNAGFEETQGATAANWRAYGKGGYVLDPQVKHGGQQAIRATGADAGAVQAIVLNQTVARPLVLRGWSKHEKPGGGAEQVMTIGQTEQAPTPSAARSSDYALYVDLHYVGGGALYGQVATFDRNAAGWQFAEKVIHVSKPVKDATLYLLHRNQPGTAWFDDVFLAEADPDLALLPGVQVTADSSYSGYTTAPLTDGVTDTEGVAWDKAAWASADSKGEHWVELTFPQEVTLKTVLIYWAIDLANTWTSRSYAVQAFVDGAWRDVATVAGQGGRDMSVHSFPPVETSRLRLLQAPGGGNAARPNILWLREIEVL
ncbi:discoidin domain-containing protein [bacterium]|nr:discoidin domain-containing protein [bacterium]